MMLVPEEFDNYQIGVDTNVTFCLKELRVLAKFIRTVLIFNVDQKNKKISQRVKFQFCLFQNFIKIRKKNLLLICANLISTLSYHRLF